MLNIVYALGAMIGLCCCLNSITAYGQKAQAKTSSLTVVSNVRGAAVTYQGLAAGKTGDAIEADPGPAEITVSAPGFGSRTVRVVVAGTAAQKIKVNLVKERTGPRLVEDPGTSEPGNSTLQPPTERPAICTTLLSSTTETPPRFCARKTLADDIAFAGITWPQPSANDASFLGFLSKLWFLRNNALPTRTLALLERAYAESPGSQLVYQALAWHLLKNGDCGRIRGILIDADSIGILSPELLLISALCKEAAGDLPNAAKDLSLATKANRKIPEVIWHQARQQIMTQTPGGRQNAVTLLATCTKSSPSYLPCQETALLLSTLPVDAAKFETNYKTANESSVRKWVKDFTAATRSGKWSVAQEILIREQNLTRGGYELAWAEFLAAMAQRFDRAVGVANVAPGPETELLMASPFAVEAIALQIEALKNKTWTQAIFGTLLRAQPNRRDLWYRMIEAEVKEAHWEAVLDLCNKAETALGAPTNILRSHKGQALLESGRTKEAIAIYREFYQADPGSWKGAYNLAGALDRDGDTENALQMYRTALILNPPEAIQNAIQARFAAHENQKKRSK